MKTLYLDIETAPISAHTWGLWQQNIGLNQLLEDPRVLCFAAKWRDSKRVFSGAEWREGRQGMLDMAHALLSEADVVVHYNGERFDEPWLNGEFARERMLPPAPFQRIDLMRAIKRRMRFPSNKLAYVTAALGVEGKLSHEGHTLWVRCLQGDAAAQRAMERYCKQDTKLLQPLHDRLAPWLTNAPNARLYDEESADGCPVCGSDDLRREGFRYTAVSKFQRYQCRQCGSWSSEGRRLGGTNVRGVAA